MRRMQIQKERKELLTPKKGMHLDFTCIKIPNHMNIYYVQILLKRICIRCYLYHNNFSPSPNPKLLVLPLPSATKICQMSSGSSETD